MPLPAFTRNFCGAIQLAIWLKENHVGISSTIRANISPGFVNCVSSLAGRPINFYWRPELKSISVCLKKPDRFEILIPESFNACHRRFALCKELCHVLTDDDSVAATNPSEQLSIAIITAQVVRHKKQILFAQSLGSEDFCFLLAMELMLPVSKRVEILHRIARKERTYDIAYELQIPESHIVFYQQSSYHSFYQICTDATGECGAN